MNHPQKYQPEEKLTLKPVIIGIILVVIVVGIYFGKNFLLNKKDATNTSELSTENKNSENLSVPMILPEDLNKLIYKRDQQIIDIRSSDDFKISHIENSQNFPIDTIKERINELDKDIPIIVIDESETKSGKEATGYLNKSGFSAKYLVGGIADFIGQGYPVISFGDPNSYTDIAKVDPISPQEIMDDIITSKSIKFLDVRKKQDFENKYHIENSVNIPLEEIESRKKEVPLSRIIVVDEDPIRSFQAAVRLNDMNFLGVYCLKTSLSEFKNYVENSSSSESETSPPPPDNEKKQN